MKSNSVIIVGAGPAGLAAAIAAAREGAAVTVLERMKKPGRKLLLTGSGRCNLTNLDPDLIYAYRKDSEGSGDETGKDTSGCVREIIRSFGVPETISMFAELGVAVTDRDGWVYPRAGQAQFVLAALLAELGRLKVKIRYDVKVCGVFRDPDEGLMHVRVDGWEYKADAVVLACGGASAPETGSDGSGFRLAEETGHRIAAPVPGLTGVIVRDRDIQTASGARTPGKVSLLRNGKLIAEESGEVQWASYGVSGIAVFQLSRRMRDIGNGTDYALRIDLAPDLQTETIAEEMTAVIRHFRGECTNEYLLSGYTNERVAAYLSKKAPRYRDADEKADSGKRAEILAALLKGKDVLYVSGLRSYEHAQITCGGVALPEVRERTLESVHMPGLFFAGEILDVDGPCGGYNLQWAWSSGHAAGEAAAHYSKS